MKPRRMHEKNSMIGLERGSFPLSGLRAFDAAARLGSFRAAADALGVTPSAVSHQFLNAMKAATCGSTVRPQRSRRRSRTSALHWRLIR
jgi:LysR family transcriptional regulator, glycine cleavage system transcriptional activator